MASQLQPILIIGAGISGLTLAQACRKEKIPYRLFDRDESVASRGAGWGLTLVKSLPAFRSLLPQDILARLPEAYVNTGAGNAGSRGNFTYFDLSTGEAKWKISPAERIRVSRRRLRDLMLTGLNVEWNKALKDLTSDDTGATAIFSDGTSATGSLLVACDGAHSTARQKLFPTNHANYQLPIRFIGAGVLYPESKIKEILRLDPYFLQGSDPRTDAYLWFSFLDVPGDAGAPSEKDENGEKMYRCQIMVSWPYREGFFGRVDPSNVPNTEFGQLIWMKSLSEQWVEPFRSVVQGIEERAEIKPVTLEDYLPSPPLSTKPHRIALVGDALHTMAMYRGEGANQAILDVSVLFHEILPLYHSTESIDNTALGKAIEKYESEAVERGGLAVLASRRACLDAHCWGRLNDQSPIVNRNLGRGELKDERPDRG